MKTWTAAFVVVVFFLPLCHRTNENVWQCMKGYAILKRKTFRTFRIIWMVFRNECGWLNSNNDICTYTLVLPISPKLSFSSKTLHSISPAANLFWGYRRTAMYFIYIIHDGIHAKQLQNIMQVFHFESALHFCLWRWMSVRQHTLAYTIPYRSIYRFARQPNAIGAEPSTSSTKDSNAL